jgi:hypothetical protein
MLEVGSGEVRHRDVADIVGTLEEGSGLEAALRSQRQIDADLWK